MTSLNIQQSTQSSETVSSSVIEKLYNLAITSTVEDENSSFSMSLQGNISVPAAFEDSVLYLRSKFPNLTINVPENKYYIRFKDPVIGNFSKTAYGDGIGVTYSEAAGVTSYLNFWGRNGMTNEVKNTVTSLEDFQYFTGSAGINETNIADFSNATEIKFPNSTFTYSGKYSKKIVDNCKNIRSINYGNAIFSCINTANDTTKADHGELFPIYGNNVIVDFDNSLIPRQTDFTNIILFWKWSALQTIIFPEGVTTAYEFFNGCVALQYVEYPTTITHIGFWFGIGQDKHNRNYVVVIKATTPPTMYYCPNNNDNDNAGWGWHNFPTAIYVPDSAVNAYKNVTPLTIGSNKWECQLGWVDQQIKDLIRPLSELPEGYLELGTVTQEDIDRV